MPGLQSAFASDQVRRSQDFLRIAQRLEGSGDIWEIDGGLKSLAIGPNSDLAQVRVSYYDYYEENLVASLDVAVGSPHIGRLDALVATQYGTEEPAKIVVGVNDLIDNAYVPWGWEEDEEITQAPAEIDLVGYFVDPPDVPMERPDKRFLFSHITVPEGVQGYNYYIVPFYGRRYARVLLVNHDAVLNVSAEVRGVRLPIGTTASGGTRSGEVALGTIGPVAAGGNVGQYVVLSSVDGVWDLLLVRIATGGLSSDYMDLRIDMSDREG